MFLGLALKNKTFAHLSGDKTKVALNIPGHCKVLKKKEKRMETDQDLKLINLDP
jgi:hypothetical protein